MSRLAFWLRSSAATSSRPFWSSAAASSSASGARQREAKLIVRLAAVWLQPCGFLQALDGVGRLAVLEQRLAERQVGPRERRLELDHLAQLFDLFAGPGAGLAP